MSAFNEFKINWCKNSNKRQNIQVIIDLFVFYDLSTICGYFYHFPLSKSMKRLKHKRLLSVNENIKSLRKTLKREVNNRTRMMNGIVFT